MIQDKINTKINIVEHAIELYQQKGVKNVSVQDICKSSGITRSGFYYHFKSKDDILNCYFLSSEVEIHEHLLPLLSSDKSYEQFKQVFRIYMQRTIQAGPEVFGQIIRSYVERHTDQLSPKQIAMREVYQALIGNAQKKGEILNHETPEKLVELIVYLSVGLSATWCNSGGSFDFCKSLENMIEMILQPKLSKHQ